MTQRRNYVRSVTKGSVKLKTEKDASLTLIAEMVDVSFKGISVYLKESIEIGTLVQFQLTLESIGWVFAGKGIVKNITELKKYDSSGFKIGIEFTEINKDDVFELLNKVQSISVEERKSASKRKIETFPN